MTEIRVTPMEPGAYGVEIEEGDVRTGHRVLLDEGFLADLGVPRADPVRVVEETVGFLLERRTSMALGDELPVRSVADRYGQEFSDELLARLGPR